LEARTNDLEFKKKQLSEIIAETEREEDILKAKSADAKKLIDQRLLDAYERIRKGATNGLAVVPIDREASAGSFIHIPPQKQMDVAARKKVIIDEHSGRILVDSILAMEQSEKINAVIIATGSEIALALQTAERLEKESAGKIGIRVVSMPSTTAFDQQDAAYKAKVLPAKIPRIAVEAGADVLVSGSYIFGSGNYQQAIQNLKKI
jgi:hypothetical protein